MEHQQAKNSGAVERYLLGDMSGSELDAFEEHLFDCSRCAQEVRTGEMLRANLRAVAADEKKSNVAPFRRRRLVVQPAWAAAAALLLMVLPLTAYHSFYVMPLQSRLAAAESPRIYESFPLTGAVRGETNVVRVDPTMRDVALSFDPPALADYDSYLIEVKSDAVQFPPLRREAPRPGLPIEVLIPASQLVAGDYRLILSGLSEGAPIEVETFNFRIEK